MSYNRPGVEITQVQATAGPNLIAPDLSAFVCGPAYKVVKVDDYSYPGIYVAGSVTISGLDSLYLDGDSVYIEVYGASGVDSGNSYVISKGYAGYSNPADGATTVTLPALASKWSNGVTDVLAGNTHFKIGYRALKLNKRSFTTVETVADISNKIGDVSPMNPAGLGASIALANANSQVFVWGAGSDDIASVRTSVSGVGLEHAAAAAAISLQEVYAIAPLTYDAATLSAWQTHCTTYSAATEKKERIMFGPSIYTLSGDAAADSRNIRDGNNALLQKRRFATFPDTFMYATTAHLGTIKPSYITAMFDTSYPAVLTSNVSSASGAILYYAGTEITETVWTELAKLNTSYFNVELPLPGYYLGAAAAGMVSGYKCEQGFTNMPVAGIAKVKGASDMFSDSQLNTIASGGTYILWQPTKFSPVTCRHQLSTDMSSVEARELNITKSLDFVAKFIRNSISGTIGRNNVTPAFLSLLTMSLKGIGTSLVRDGRVNGFNVLSVTQDTVNKDTILVSINVLPKYPVNYIKIDLIF